MHRKWRLNCLSARNIVKVMIHLTSLWPKSFAASLCPKSFAASTRCPSSLCSKSFQLSLCLKSFSKSFHLSLSPKSLRISHSFTASMCPKSFAAHSPNQVCVLSLFIEVCRLSLLFVPLVMHAKFVS